MVQPNTTLVSIYSHTSHRFAVLPTQRRRSHTHKFCDFLFRSPDKLASYVRASMSKRGRGVWDVVEMGSVDTARVLMLLAHQSRLHAGAVGVGSFAGGGATHDRVFECKTCSRQFPTFQALGGHRASHKRPRLLQQQHVLGGTVDDAGLFLGRQTTSTPPQPAKPRVHECPVCGLEFPIGQALGGHMRRHRAETEMTSASKAASGKACDGGGVCLDLNLTPSENCAKCRNVVGLGAAGQGVHKALAMLDCSL